MRFAGRAFRVLLVLAVLAAVVLFARKVNWSETWGVIRASSPVWIAAAAVANLLSIALKGVRWWLFLRAIGVDSLALALRAFFAGAALNNVLIANSGEVARIALVSRATNTPTAPVLATLLIERYFETFGYAMLLAAAATFMSLPPSLVALRPFAYLGVAAMLGLLVYLARRSGGAVILSEANRGSAPEASLRGRLPIASAAKDLQLSFADRIKRYGREFVDAVTAVSSGRRFVVATMITIAVWALQFLSYHWTAVAAGLPMPLVGSMAALLAVNVSFATRATPGNVGVFQAIYALAASYFGLDKDVAVGVSLLIQFQQQVPVTLLGLIGTPGILRARETSPTP